MSEITSQTEKQSPLAARYVDAEKLLEILFDEASRPSLRWMRDQQKAGRLPFAKIGRLVFFDPVACKAALDAKSAGRRGVR
jgi:hypothetical protein